ncbi:GFA family protein [Sandarakinorhabdus rubra]|uniref:GFA family protein n=1 Tax=Sandarakinorhabdus rubra TaxID=2672568 RepID=UPI0013DD5A96|nr:GFA family protein [Sandarakinorhabdus rubra]
MADLEGGCLCGAVRYTTSAEPVMQAVCHCRNCQKQAGSGWSMIMGVPAAALSITGEVKTYEDQGESGGAVRRQFCSNCGSPLFSRVSAAPDLVFIKAGTLDDTSQFTPQMQFWTDSKQHWIELPGIPAMARNPG